MVVGPFFFFIHLSSGLESIYFCISLISLIQLYRTNAINFQSEMMLFLLLLVIVLIDFISFFGLSALALIQRAATVSNAKAKRPTKIIEKNEKLHSFESYR